MPRHRRLRRPVVPASLAAGMLGAAALGGAAVPATAAVDGPVATAASPVPDAVLPPPVSLRPREVITDLGL